MRNWKRKVCREKMRNELEGEDKFNNERKNQSLRTALPRDEAGC